MAIVPHVDDCSALWLGNPTLIDIDVHLHCVMLSIYKIELDAFILTFSGNLLWSLLTTFFISKCMLFHNPEDCIGTITEFFALVQPTVKSNEVCLYLLQLLAHGILSTQEINSVPFSPAILANRITPSCHLHFDLMLPYSTMTQHHTLLHVIPILLGATLEYALSGLTVLLNQLDNQIHAMKSFGNQQICGSYQMDQHSRPTCKYPTSSNLSVQDC